MDEFLDGTNLLIDRGVTRLDGARGKKQVRRPLFSNPGSSGSKCAVLKNVRVTLLGFFGAKAVFQCPQSDLAPG